MHPIHRPRSEASTGEAASLTQCSIAAKAATGNRKKPPRNLPNTIYPDRIRETAASSLSSHAARLRPSSTGRVRRPARKTPCENTRAVL